MNNKVVLIVVAVVLVVAAFVAGGYIGPKFLPGASTSARSGFPGGAGGPMGNLTAEEQAKVQNMSDSERRAYFQQRMGASGGTNAQGGPGRMGGGIEGEVLTVASDQITIKTTAGGSQNIYIDAKTVYAYAKGVAEHDLAKGDKVVVIAQPETDGVMSATTIVIK
ncbi:MAG TPA: hypothetical protein VFG89_02725 [Coriobacteriia bacterium]|nr:hypothetical protein [Coriobacteriia bacterium]